MIYKIQKTYMPFKPSTIVSKTLLFLMTNLSNKA